MKQLRIIVLGIVALVGIGACALAGTFITAPTATPQTSVQGAPPLQPAATQPSDNADMTVTLSERYLNRTIAQGLAQGGQVQSAELDIHSGAIVDVNAVVQVNSQLRLSPKVTMLLEVQNGRIVVTVQKVDVGGFGVPNSLIEPQVAQLKETAETNLNAQLANLAASTGLKLQVLSTTENSLTLFFVQ